MATKSFEKMADSLYDCMWYGLDEKLQKYILIMITNAQKPIYYHGFGVAVLVLETFTKVSNGLLLTLVLTSTKNNAISLIFSTRLWLAPPNILITYGRWRWQQFKLKIIDSNI